MGPKDISACQLSVGFRFPPRIDDGLCNLGFSIIGHAGRSAPVGLTISGMGEKGIERINVLGFVMVKVRV